MLRHIVLFVALAAGPAPLVGCQSQDPYAAGRPMDHADTPRSWRQARYYEEQGLREVEVANEQRDLRKRREYFDRALSLFRRARDLYTQELIEAPGTPERQRNLKREITRLERLIERTHRERPIG